LELPIQLVTVIYEGRILLCSGSMRVRKDRWLKRRAELARRFERKFHMAVALVVVDAQNEFSAGGKRPVPNHADALTAIRRQVDRARQERRPIAWVCHFNKPHETPAFHRGTWGARFSPGLGPQTGFGIEALFEKEVYGAFTGTAIEEWLRLHRVQSLLVVGFYAHMCLSTCVREALSRGFQVLLDPDATGSCDLDSKLFGKQTADEVRRSALLHLTNMGAIVADDRMPSLRIARAQAAGGCTDQSRERQHQL
jgi:nicotinamidase-related amidase